MSFATRPFARLRFIARAAANAPRGQVVPLLQSRDIRRRKYIYILHPIVLYTYTLSSPRIVGNGDLFPAVDYSVFLRFFPINPCLASRIILSPLQSSCAAGTLHMRPNRANRVRPQPYVIYYIVFYVAAAVGKRGKKTRRGSIDYHNITRVSN